MESKTKIKYTKAQLVVAKQYQAQRDALSVVLTDGETYTKQEAEKLLKQFYERKV